MHYSFPPAALAALSITHALTLPQAFAAGEPIYQLDEIVVTATRTAQPSQATLAATTTLTRADIERLQPHSFQDLLTGLAGVDLANNGGLGQATSLFLRGADADHVVVLIDGVKIGSATTGVTAFQDLPMAAIERIEIVRGPLSSLYGSEAIGGVIHIFTRKGGGATTPRFSVGAGRYGTRQLRAGVSGGGQDAWYDLGLAHVESDGFSASKGAETDADASRNTSINLRAGRRLASGTQLDAHLLHARGKTDYDGSYSNEIEVAQLVAGASLEHRFNPAWLSRISLGQSRDEADNFHNGAYMSRFDTRRDSLTWQNDLDLGPRRHLTLGIDHLRDTVDSSTAYTVDSRRDTGVFAQWMAGAGVHDFKLSLRRDDNSQFGHASTGNAAWGMNLGGGLRSRVAYGTGFKAPSFNELYYPGFGNADLEPERARSLEAGLSGRLPGGRWSANLYETHVDDLIGFDAQYTPVNINSARLRGLEFDSTTRFGVWDARLNLTWQDPENRGVDANRGNLLPRRAKHSGRLDLDRDLGAWRVGGSLVGIGSRYDNLANSVRLDGYALVDLRAETRIDKDWLFQGRIENLFDAEYETAATYNQPGRGLYLTLNYQPVR
jgi:vitamin B12 transporter